MMYSSVKNKPIKKLKTNLFGKSHLLLKVKNASTIYPLETTSIDFAPSPNFESALQCFFQKKNPPKESPESLDAIDTY